LLCCSTDADCGGNNPCLGGLCIDNLCTYASDFVPPTGCCEADADCDDGLPLTEDACVGYFCVNLVPDCDAPWDCDDGAPCTEELCIGGSCKWKPIEGCCLVDADCDDWNDCTIDDCTLAPEAEAGICETAVNYSLGWCCESASECADGNVVTKDLCIDFHCFNVTLPSCCGSGNDSCNDGNPCTCDFCVGGDCHSVHTKYLEYFDYEPCLFQAIPPNCCNSVDDCNKGGLCDEAACVGMLCQYTPIPGCDG